MPEQEYPIESVPAWVRLRALGHKPALYLASVDKTCGVVLLVCPKDTDLKGIAWWSGDWSDDALTSQIEWSRSSVYLHEWAYQHPVVRQFGPILQLLAAEVNRTAN